MSDAANKTKDKLMNTPPKDFLISQDEIEGIIEQSPWFNTEVELEDEEFDGLEDWLVDPEFTPVPKKSAPENKCTCGANSAYGEDYGSHSDWCDLFK